MQNLDVLHSWKDIARYVGRGVRTVQRWEHDLGFPIHRPRGKERSAVLAFASEIDEWLMNTPIEATSGNEISDSVGRRFAEFYKKTEMLMARARLLMSNSQKLQEQINQAIKIRNLQYTKSNDANMTEKSQSRRAS